jgi:probable HAF family extracellular repeat protein
MIDLGTLPGSANSQAATLSPLGQVAGSSDTASGNWHATVWPSPGTIVDLGTLGGTDRTQDHGEGDDD